MVRRAERAERARITRRTSAEATSSTSARKWSSSAAARGANHWRTNGGASSGARLSGSNAAPARAPTAGRGGRVEVVATRLHPHQQAVEARDVDAVASRRIRGPGRASSRSPRTGRGRAHPRATSGRGAPRRAAARTCRGRDGAGGRASCAHAPAAPAPTTTARGRARRRGPPAWRPWPRIRRPAPSPASPPGVCATGPRRVVGQRAARSAAGIGGWVEKSAVIPRPESGLAM